MNRPLLITLFHYGTGIMDALTGLCLIFAPVWTLGMMKVAPRPEAPHLVSYIGVFVFAVGCSHFLAGRFPSDALSRERWKTIWKTTSIVRFSVAAFVLSRVLSGSFETAWLAVTATDFTVALIFIALLIRKQLNPS